MKVLLSLLTALLFVEAYGHAADGRTVRILTVGNSFSRNATNHLNDLAKARGHRLIHTPIVVGGASLELHSEKAIKYAADPKSSEGLYKSGNSLVKELKAEKWDYVTIQQASIKSHDLATYQPHASRLAALIHEHAPTAKLLIHQTWAYRRDDPRFTKSPNQLGEPSSLEQMYHGLDHAYATIAEELNAQRLPVGTAFFLADTDSEWAYLPPKKLDLKSFKQPKLPSQKHSLHVGWRWTTPKGGKGLALGMDGHHANVAGEYLGACVWFETLYGESPVGISYIPKGLEPAYATFLQETAHRAVIAEKAKKSAAIPQGLDGLVAFWDFQEESGQPRAGKGKSSLVLQEKKGPIKRSNEGVFGPSSARIKIGQWFIIPREEIGALNIHGPKAQVTLVSWVKREAKDSWQAIAGVWDETHKKRQYCLFLNAPRGTKADEMKRYPLANRIHGHVSSIGGPTPGEEFCITYSSGASEIPLNKWVCLAMQYDGKESRVYVNGKLDSFEQYNPFPYVEGLYDGGEDGADFTVGAVHRGGSWGNFFGGQIGGLAVYDRVLSGQELQQLADLIPE